MYDVTFHDYDHILWRQAQIINFNLEGKISLTSSKIRSKAEDEKT